MICNFKYALCVEGGVSTNGVAYIDMTRPILGHLYPSQSGPSSGRKLVMPLRNPASVFCEMRNGLCILYYVFCILYFFFFFAAARGICGGRGYDVL